MNNSDLENKITKHCKELIQEKGYLTSIDILLRLKYLTEKDLENWRFGRVAYLEKVCSINLKKLSTINKTIRKISRLWNLKESWTAYNKFGKGKKTRLQFSKSGNESIEKSYATHYMNPIQLEKIKHERTTINKQNCNTQ